MTDKSEDIRLRLEGLVKNFESELQRNELREKVLSLVPMFRELRLLGKSLIPAELASSARDRILHYFLKYPQTIIHGDELLVVSGIQEYARRVRELRIQFGWSIASGLTIGEMMNEGEEFPQNFTGLRPEEYVLLTTEQDVCAAYRWNVANDIRKQSTSIRDRILAYLKANVGQPVTGEELRYVARNKTEWARRVRELRTEHGWSIVTHHTGRPDLPIGTYVLESDRQSPEHDRTIPDAVRRSVLRRDHYRCTQCGWSHEEWNPSDPRHLELHHVHPHAEGGKNQETNLVTLCTTCHDQVHAK
ncbi:MAG: HNH endonuclease [Bacteroidetes bacterium]|nr:HNH endonuclease [Bacteroidota bacterium]